MVRDISIDLWLCSFILAGRVYTWRVQPSLTFLWCNTYLMAVKIIKIGLAHYSKKNKVQREREWTLVSCVNDV